MNSSISPCSAQQPIVVDGVSLIPAELIEARGDQLMTDSLKIADVFGRLHRSILRSIKSLDCSDEFTEHNFVLSEYRDETGRALPKWEMTKDGFMFLVMGFTGKKAARIKEGYIRAFNIMADALFGRARQVSANSLTGTTIGTDGFRCLAAVLDGKVRHLPSPVRKRAKHHLWQQVHKAFSVVSAEDIPANQMDSARNFIGSYTLEGEWLEAKVEPVAATLDDMHLRHLFNLYVHFKHVYDIYDRYSLYEAMSLLGSRAGLDMHDHLKDGLLMANSVARHLKPQFDQQWAAQPNLRRM